MLTDDRARREELAESDRVQQRGLAVARTVESVTAKVDRMNRIYRERLEGNRGSR